MVLKGSFFSPDNGFYSWVCKDETIGTVLTVGPLLDFKVFYLVACSEDLKNGILILNPCL
jgi:hypothetical protein